MCGPAVVPIAAAVSAVAGVASAVNQAKQAKKADKRAAQANETAKKNAADALQQQEREINRKNAKKPNVAAILSTNKQATQNQTLLSGPQGVDPGSLQLGTNTLLGQ